MELIVLHIIVIILTSICSQLMYSVIFCTSILYTMECAASRHWSKHALCFPNTLIFKYLNLMKASFWGLFKTNFCGHFHKLFLFTKFNFSKFLEKVFLTVLRSMCLEFCASNYFRVEKCFISCAVLNDRILLFYQMMHKQYYSLALNL